MGNARRKALFLLLLILANCATRKEINRFKVQMDYLEQSNAQLQRHVARLDSLLEEEIKLVRSLTAQSDLHMQLIQEEIIAVRNALQESGLQVEEVTRKLEDVTTRLSTPMPAPVEQDSTLPLTQNELPSAELLFRKAFLDQAKGNFKEAIVSYKELIEKHSSSSFAHQAIYQLGECYYAIGDYNQSISYFSTLLQKYKQSLLIPSALYKVALAYIELNNKALAKAYLNQLLRDYPKTNEAKLAEKKLREL